MTPVVALVGAALAVSAIAVALSWLAVRIVAWLHGMSPAGMKSLTLVLQIASAVVLPLVCAIAIVLASRRRRSRDRARPTGFRR